MNLEQYNRIHDFFITHSSAFSLLLMANRFLTACGFLLYPLLLLFLLLKGELLMLCSFIFIPAICFLIVTIFRKLINKQRPYEKLPIQSLIKKREKGTVFPKPPCIFYLFNCNIMVLFLETNRNLSSYCWHFSRNCQSNWRRTFYKRRICRSVSWYHRRVDF